MSYKVTHRESDYKKGEDAQTTFTEATDCVVTESGILILKNTAKETIAVFGANCWFSVVDTDTDVETAEATSDDDDDAPDYTS